MDEGWIEKIIKKNMPSEKSLEDISKQMLAHNLQVKIDELKTITEERDDLAKENERLTEENSNLETLLKQKMKLRVGHRGYLSKNPTPCRSSARPIITLLA